MLLRKSLSLPNTLTKMLRSKAGIWFPEFDHFINPQNNVLAIVGKPYGNLIIPASNIVTNAGDLYYAQLCAGESPSPANTFTWWEMQSAGTPAKDADRSDFTAIASSGKAETAGYPKTNDADGDNTGAGTDVRTSSVSYTAADFNDSGITHGIVTNTTPAADEDILSGWAWAATINKTAADTLKCFLNHTLNGV